MLALILLLALAPFHSQEKPKYDMQVRQLVFLVTPDKQKAGAPQANEAMQKDHLALLEKLWRERKILLVGPTQDSGNIRGLMLMDVKTKEEALDLLKDEPYLKHGIMEADVKPWFVARNVPQKGDKFLDIEPYWFGFLKRPKDAPEITKEEAQKIQAGHMANIEKMAASGDLVLAGPMGADLGELRGIFIFRTKDKKKIEELVSHDPAIQKNRLKLELFRWYTAKGTFPKS